ncbi:hypothetical protein HY480_04585 [Candidatus Uhrbacteria bacterium]|nr:hypothetical protein [Candidatus Uhrbacteria bacterium]
MSMFNPLNRYQLKQAGTALGITAVVLAVSMAIVNMPTMIPVVVGVVQVAVGMHLRRFAMDRQNDGILVGAIFSLLCGLILIGIVLHVTQAAMVLGIGVVSLGIGITTRTVNQRFVTLLVVLIGAALLGVVFFL